MHLHLRQNVLLLVLSLIGSEVVLSATGDVEVVKTQRAIHVLDDKQGQAVLQAPEVRTAILFSLSDISNYFKHTYCMFRLDSVLRLILLSMHSHRTATQTWTISIHPTIRSSKLRPSSPTYNSPILHL